MSEDLEELRLWATRVESDVADLALALAQVREELAEAVAGGGVRAFEPALAEVEAWVRDELASVYARALSPRWRWCSRWVEHPEAVLRLRALHTGWREAQQTGRWLSYLRDLDAQMSALTDAAGTFAACTEQAHYPPPARLPGEHG